MTAAVTCPCCQSPAVALLANMQQYSSCTECDCDWDQTRRRPDTRIAALEAEAASERAIATEACVQLDAAKAERDRLHLAADTYAALLLRWLELYAAGPAVHAVGEDTKTALASEKSSPPACAPAPGVLL